MPKFSVEFYSRFQSCGTVSDVAIDGDVMVGLSFHVQVRSGVGQPVEQVVAPVDVEMMVQVTFVPLDVFAVADPILDCTFLEPAPAIPPKLAAKMISESGFHHAVRPL
ncbi:MAG: hypothetical protein OXF79_20910 [Chloroflexi bacterium]|nr:hypothetical protein [Chloroflexota bacterium]